MYASGWVMARVRIFSSVARLAVMVAMAPESKRICTLATSVDRECTEAPDRGDLARLAVHEAEHDVDVVDHEVHDHGVVLHARHEGAEAPRLDEDGPLDDLAQLLHGAVEALDVADVEHAVRLARDPEQLLGLLEGRRHRLLDEHVHARLEQVARHLEVPLGRHRDRGEVDRARRARGGSRTRGAPYGAATRRALARSASTTPTSSTPQSSARARMWYWPMCPAPTTRAADARARSTALTDPVSSLSALAAAPAARPGMTPRFERLDELDEPGHQRVRRRAPP